MKRRVSMLAGFAALVAIAGPAAADWEKTHWGAKVADTILAVGGDTAGMASDPRENIWGTEIGARGKGEYDGIGVRRDFYFDAKGGLVIVKLVPADEDCGAFRKAVTRNLGTSDRASKKTIGNMATSETMSWVSQPDNLVILFYEMRFTGSNVGGCHLIYQPYGDGLSGQRNAAGRTIVPVN